MKLKTLLLEYDDKVAKYSDELGTYIKALRPKIGKLKFDIERMTGSWIWEDREIGIYATLGWEGKKEVPIEPDDGAGTVKTLKYKPTFDMKKDSKWYLSNMKRFLPGVKKDMYHSRAGTF